MKEQIIAAFDHTLQAELAKRFGTSRESLTPLGDFENFVFSFPSHGTDRILRVSHHSHRNHDQILAELQWVNFLANNGVAVCRAVESEKGRLVEPVSEGRDRFYSVAFEKAPGEKVGNDDWGPSLIWAIGEIIGRIHHLTQHYQPPAPKRFHWHDDPHMLNFEMALPATLADQAARLMDSFQSLPIQPDSYGLIHTDVHAGNFHWHQNQLYLFDTDDCCYHYFLFDIVHALYYGLWRPVPAEERPGYAITFMRHFWEGYFQHHYIDAGLVDRFPDIMRLRDLQILTALKTSEGGIRPKLVQFMNKLEQRLLQGIPFVDLNPDDIRPDIAGSTN